MLKLKRIATAILFSTIIPTIGYRVEKDTGAYYFGVPADGLFYDGRHLTLASLGLICNFFFFYWVIKLILKIWKVRTVEK